MEEIKVGEYVRTTYGEIGEYLGIDDKYGMYDYDVNGNKSSCRYYEIVKHSFNIIDLIEVGDYVNGEEVIKRTGKVITTYCNEYITDQYFETILTKEQYTANCYEVK